ncbi:hypothetical protein LWI29_034268 [Acer saccharum]|uniref:Telomerase reverse transcriptase n=1 Tax=Acer saccharum TaxID=4024 RepID=A0AA39RJJ5_ACESA|nr:hypothetical protein LWI29_034268 [Acer saccharum]
MSFLLRPDDPSDYRSLLDNCFVVVNDRAPPLLDFSPENRWSQKQVGDSVMVYILKYTSIFLPVSPKKHHQVAGPPITEKSFKLSKLRANPPKSTSFICSIWTSEEEEKS